jgi:signal peptidase II
VSPGMEKRQGALRWLWLSLAVVIADQLTKALIVREFELYEVLDVLPVLEITRLHNTGAAFSMLAGASGWQRWFFIGLALVVSAGIVYWLRNMPRNSAAYLHWNAAYFPAFNVADTCITIGAGLLILDAILDGRKGSAAEAGP